MEGGKEAMQRGGVTGEGEMHGGRLTAVASHKGNCRKKKKWSWNSKI